MPNTSFHDFSTDSSVVTASRQSANVASSRSWIGARLDRDRDGLLVFFVGVVLFRVAAAVYFLTHLLVAAAPVVMLASRVAISHVDLSDSDAAFLRASLEWWDITSSCAENPKMYAAIGGGGRRASVEKGYY